MKRIMLFFAVCAMTIAVFAQTTMELRHSGETTYFSTKGGILLGNHSVSDDGQVLLDIAEKNSEGECELDPSVFSVSLGDTITFSDRSFLQPEKKEYHFINVHNTAEGNWSSRECKIRLKYSGGDNFRIIKTERLDEDNWLIGDGLSYHKYPTYIHPFYYYRSTSDDVRRCRLVFHWTNDIERSNIFITDTVTIYNHPVRIIPVKGIVAPEGGLLEIQIEGDTTIHVKAEDEYGYTNQLSDEIRDGKLIARLLVAANNEESRRNICLKFSVWDSVKDLWIRQGGCHVMTEAEQRELLTTFYKATDGDNWRCNDNWLTDKPLSQWYGLCREDIVSAGCMETFSLVGNNLQGEIPKEYAKILDLMSDSLIQYPQIGLNNLYGRIPDEVANHPLWQGDIGWGDTDQNDFVPPMTNYNLKLENGEVELFDKNEIVLSHDILAKNELTLFFYAGATDWFSPVSTERVNLYLDYRNKGLGMVGIVSGQNFDEFQDVFELQEMGLPTAIRWAKRKGKTGNHFVNILRSTIDGLMLFDKQGNLVHRRTCSGGIREFNDELDSIFRSRLGEPEKHEPFVYNHYTSTDYSHDGEVLTLQKATKGKGVDIVFMGDMYVDTLLVAGGQYEKDMQAAMESFFEVEPYKSLRDRFNVYAVKAVSPNGYWGPEHKFSGDVDVFEYAHKISNVDMDNVAITLIYNNPDPVFVSAFTNMYGEASISVITNGKSAGGTISHEMGGHGIAKLYDEYIYPEYEHNHTQEGSNESFREWIKTAYHDKGWGMNISATDDPNEVPWAHFLKDERYKDEVGIYQGAWYWPEELWRPSENSIMRDPEYLWFNAPSREAIYKRVMKLSEGEGWTYDFEKFVEFDLPIRDTNKRVRAKARAKGDNEEPIEKRRVDLRPPTIYKGSWREANKGETVEFIPEPK